MSQTNREVVIVGAQRTPIGSFLGALAALPATELGALAIKAALAQAGVEASAIEEVYMGCVLPAGLGQAPARQAALAAGLAESTPCTTVNKVCGSGLKTVLLAADAIRAGHINMAVAGGMESMSNAPHLLPNIRTGQKIGNLELLDSMVHDGLWDVYNNQHMGRCAELCAKEKNITRTAQDAFATESYRRAQAATQNGKFQNEITALTLATPKGEIVVESDEELTRAKPEKLATLRPAFQKDGTVTAGNASSLNDGGAAVVLTTRDEAKKRGLPILGSLVAQGQHAQAPLWFTTTPAAAIAKACKQAGWAAQDVDLWEINEAFAVVSLVNHQALGLSAEKVNIHGGAIALGHPIGASGCRLLVTLLHAMKDRQAQTGGVSLCIGGGEGLALLLKRD